MARWIIIAATGLTITVLWSSAYLLPFKLLVVLVHEMWHGISALLSGAFLAQIHIDFQESGETIVNRLESDSGFILTVSAGYLGSTITGAFLLHHGLRQRLGRVYLGLFALSLAYMSYVFTIFGSTAFLVGLGWAAALGIISLFMPAVVSSGALLLLGTLFLWYCFYDLLDFARDISATDAGILAVYLVEKNWAPSGIDVASLTGWIAALWSLMALIIVLLFFYGSMKMGGGSAIKMKWDTVKWGGVKRKTIHGTVNVNETANETAGKIVNKSLNLSSQEAP